MEAKKGFLAIGIILFICLAAAAVVAFLGWAWWNNSGMASMINQSMNRPPMDIDRTEFDSYIKGLEYSCDGEKPTSYGDYENVICSRQIQGMTFNLAITYSRKTNQPISMVLNLNVPAGDGREKIIAAAFAELVRIPYEGSKPDEAAAWMNQCWEFDEVDTLSVSKTISGVTFSFFMYAGQYQLSIGSIYPFEDTPENSIGSD
jgi:hypothetical protein